jgi:hypothetical protein
MANSHGLYYTYSYDFYTHFHVLYYTLSWSLLVFQTPLQHSDLATQFPFFKIISIDVAIVSLHLPEKLAMKRHNFLNAKNV